MFCKRAKPGFVITFVLILLSFKRYVFFRFLAPVPAKTLTVAFAFVSFLSSSSLSKWNTEKQKEKYQSNDT